MENEDNTRPAKIVLPNGLIYGDPLPPDYESDIDKSWKKICEERGWLGDQSKFSS